MIRDYAGAYVPDTCVNQDCKDEDGGENRDGECGEGWDGDQLLFVGVDKLGLVW